MSSVDDLGGRRSPKNHLDSLFRQISPDRENKNRSKSVESNISNDSQNQRYLYGASYDYAANNMMV